MRITGGTLRGRTVYCPPGIIRPAMDRMRESVFSILGSLDGASFLDLFSGSGLVGLEAWSRGANPVVLVEKDRGKRRGILKNIGDLESGPVLRMEPVERYVQRNRRVFDVVYLDPPFDYAYKQDLLRRLGESATLHDDTIILIHAPASEDLPETISATTSLIRYDQRDYGGSRVHFYRREQTAGDETPGDETPAVNA